MITKSLLKKDRNNMSKLYFRYSAMNAGKSTALLQVAYNYRERDQRPIIAKPAVDTKSDKVLSRLKVSTEVDWNIEKNSHIIEDFLDEEIQKVDCILVDEAQFLEKSQIDQLFLIAVTKNIPVIAYGLRSDFQTNAFPGSIRLFELAHSIEEMKTICRCGAKAMFNGRKVNNQFTNEGDQVAIDGSETPTDESLITYESLCGKCFLQKVGPIS